MNKMVKKKLTKDNDSYFVSVKNPLETRRQLLESTKKSLVSLQNYHRLLLIRQEKLKHIENLKLSVKEILYLNTKLTEKLPEFNPIIINEFKREKPPAEKKPIEKKPVETKPVVKEKPKTEKTELEKLEDSLNSIEEKLKTLG